MHTFVCISDFTHIAMKKTATIALFFALLLTGKAQDNLSNRRFIEVTGVNETEVVPDQITILIRLTENKENGTIQKQEEALKTGIKELGISLSDLTLNSADADYQRTRILKKEVVVTKSYLLKVSSADMVSKVYEKLDKINVQDAFIQKIDHSKINDLKKESRIMAIKAAKEKADYLLTAVGEKAGQPIQISEQEMYTPVYTNMRYMAKAADAESVGGDDEISFKKIRIKSSVMVKYEILNK